jgi:hypothetical protein
MSIIALLHSWLKENLPRIHVTRLTALMAAVEAGLSGASVSITEFGRSLSGPAYIKHKIKRHLNPERMALYGAMTQWLLQSLPAHAVDPYRLVASDGRSASAALTSGAAYRRTFRYLVRRNSSR